MTWTRDTDNTFKVQEKENVHYPWQNLEEACNGFQVSHNVLDLIPIMPGMSLPHQLKFRQSVAIKAINDFYNDRDISR